MYRGGGETKKTKTFPDAHLMNLKILRLVLNGFDYEISFLNSSFRDILPTKCMGYRQLLHLRRSNDHAGFKRPM